MEPILHPTDFVFADRYRIRRRVDVGTVVQTYVAADQVRQEDITLKILHDDIVEEGGGFPEISKTLRRCSRLNHAAISRIFDFGVWQNQIFLATEHVTSPTLREELDRLAKRSESFSLDRINRIVRRIIEALEYAHPIIPHGNLRPENIHLEPDEAQYYW